MFGPRNGEDKVCPDGVRGAREDLKWDCDLGGRGWLSELGFMGFVGWAGFLRGCELIFEFAARTIFEESLFERLRVVQGLGGGLSYQTT